MSDILVVQKTVSKREFVRQASKYIGAEGEYYVTSIHGDYEVIVRKANCQTKKINTVKEVKGVLGNVDFSEYGCGCKRKEGLILCGEHGRF